MFSGEQAVKFRNDIIDWLADCVDRPAQIDNEVREVPVVSPLKKKSFIGSSIIWKWFNTQIFRLSACEIHD